MGRRRGRGRVGVLDGDAGRVWGERRGEDVGGEGVVLGAVGGDGPRHRRVERGVGAGALFPLSSERIEAGGDAVGGRPAGGPGVGVLEETRLVRERRACRLHRGRWGELSRSDT